MPANEGVKVLILGGGGREDALAWKLRQSQQVGAIYLAPGNGGTERLANTYRVLVNPNDVPAVVQAAKELQVGFVVVGPEEPLIHGVADALRAEKIPTYGPGADGALLEGSKAAAVAFMQEFGVPHPTSQIFRRASTAITFLQTTSWWREGGVVIKADGLAAGKGVFVCDNRDAAIDAVERIVRREEFGDAGRAVVVQKKRVGYEASIMAVVSGDRYFLLPSSEDHKQIYDGDRGPNTGGMGVVAPHRLLTPALLETIEETVIRRTLYGLKQRGIDFRGTLYPGIMVTPDGVEVLEYNVRFGDPECEALAVLLAGDWFKLLWDAATGQLGAGPYLRQDRQSSVVVTLASAGYPGAYEKGWPIYGLPQFSDRSDVVVFHAGTVQEENGYRTAGGRALMVAGASIDVVYSAIGPGGIHFKGMHYRKDIGRREKVLP